MTRDRIGDDLTALGLGPGDTVMFHTRLSAIGYVPGGPQTVIDALLDVVGPTGTLMVSCGWNDAPPYDFTTWPSAWQDAVRAHHPAYDPELSEAEHTNGRLPEALRRRPGAVRSRHPDASLAALGPSAAALMADHPWDDPHGPGSPLAHLVALGGRVLLLGAPGKRFVTYEQPVRVDGVREWRTFHDIDSTDGAFDCSRVVPEGQDPFAVIVRAMLDAGIGRTGTVGAADSRLFDAGPAVDFGVRWIEEQLNAPG